MKKILLSILSIGAVAVVVVAASQAFFSDTEISPDNKFEAGSIDLKIDSDCHYYQLDSFEGDVPHYTDVGCWIEPDVRFGYWPEKDLVAEKFFWFEDLKPGDWGENTISLHVYDNDAWGRIYLANVEDRDNDCTEPELEDEDVCGTDGTGELDEFMQALVWLDQGLVDGFQCSSPGQPGTPECAADPKEGDNKWDGEQYEPKIVESIDADWSYALSGILSNAYTLGGANPDVLNPVGLYEDGRMKGSITYYLGVGWCFGDWDMGTGYCDGSDVDNTPQTDGLYGDVGFEVEQHRNNPNPFE